jgi:selenide, water dikinase
MNESSLMRYVRGGGCASKIGPGELSSILCDMETLPDPNVLAGFKDFEDAGVYRLTDEIALVQTVDFLTPVLHDPFLFGQVAAANALSDVYAKGAIPRTAMNLVCFSPKHYDLSLLKAIIKGGVEKMKEAKVSLIGGHSVDDVEIKYGLSVTGIVHPQKLIRNRGARPGDLLILTKPLGMGVIVTALKEGMASDHVTEKVVEAMTQLNDKGSRLLIEMEAHAATDVTGFGLIGHLTEMLDEGLDVRLSLDMVPFIEGVLELSVSGVASGGMARNKEYYGSQVTHHGQDPRIDLLFDPQTSGGLLFAMDPSRFDLLRHLGDKLGVEAKVIGTFTAAGAGKRIYID